MSADSRVLVIICAVSVVWGAILALAGREEIAEFWRGRRVRSARRHARRHP